MLIVKSEQIIDDTFSRYLRLCRFDTRVGSLVKMTVFQNRIAPFGFFFSLRSRIVHLISRFINWIILSSMVWVRSLTWILKFWLFVIVISYICLLLIIVLGFLSEVGIISHYFLDHVFYINIIRFLFSLYFFLGLIVVIVSALSIVLFEIILMIILIGKARLFLIVLVSIVVILIFMLIILVWVRVVPLFITWIVWLLLPVIIH